jgi:hypothetical protein
MRILVKDLFRSLEFTAGGKKTKVHQAGGNEKYSSFCLEGLVSFGLSMFHSLMKLPKQERNVNTRAGISMG